MSDISKSQDNESPVEKAFKSWCETRLSNYMDPTVDPKMLASLSAATTLTSPGKSLTDAYQFMESMNARPSHLGMFGRGLGGSANKAAPAPSEDPKIKNNTGPK